MEERPPNFFLGLLGLLWFSAFFGFLDFIFMIVRDSEKLKVLRVELEEEENGEILKAEERERQRKGKKAEFDKYCERGGGVKWVAVVPPELTSERGLRGCEGVWEERASGEEKGGSEDAPRGEEGEEESRREVCMEVMENERMKRKFWEVEGEEGGRELKRLCTRGEGSDFGSFGVVYSEVERVENYALVKKFTGKMKREERGRSEEHERLKKRMRADEFSSVESQIDNNSRIELSCREKRVREMGQAACADCDEGKVLKMRRREQMGQSGSGGLVH